MKKYKRVSIKRVRSVREHMRNMRNRVYYAIHAFWYCCETGSSYWFDINKLSLR